ncbi:MAG: hypothetical protein A3F11_01815 [Gammaproteobacteria bacterium RIFCSPHIGHO2_12_FULL_37_14]|nr:MAG: hypothetical protein A3F11_01815 [Gammaproteobacteria bacterium RIFCSPHIGHO2_12_FULL_37_14]
MKKLSILSSIFLASFGMTIAAHSSSTIPLEGGNIAPMKKISIFLQKLVPQVKYNVSCNIHDENNQENQVFIYVDVMATNSNEITLNGKLIAIGEGGGIGKLSKVDNQLIANSLTNWGRTDSALEIQNLDHLDTISVDNCIATPALS